MTTAIIETAEVDYNDPINLVCVCGNTNSPVGVGYFETDEFGTPFQMDGVVAEDGVISYPTDHSVIHIVCFDCGRVYDTKPIITKNVAPVAFQMTSEVLDATSALYNRVNGLTV